MRLNLANAPQISVFHTGHFESSRQQKSPLRGGDDERSAKVSESALRLLPICIRSRLCSSNYLLLNSLDDRRADAVGQFRKPHNDGLNLLVS